MKGIDHMATLTTTKETTVTIQELEEFSIDFLASNYDLAFTIPIKRNNRLTRALGRYRHYLSGNPINIELSGRLLDYGTKETILDTLKHELIHHALHMLKKP